MAKPIEGSWDAPDDHWSLARPDRAMMERKEGKTGRVKVMDKRLQTSLGRQLAAVFDDTAHSEPPQDICELLSRLDRS